MNFQIDDLLSFVNQQKHVRKDDGTLDIVRPLDIVCGAFNNQSNINTTRFTLNNNKKLFFKLLHKQFYDKLLNPSTTTYAIGQELNGIHKIVVDIDCVSEEECMFPVFLEVKNILARLFECPVTVYAREANKIEESQNSAATYKHGCHMILNAYVDSKDNENVYEHIVRCPRIAELIEKYGKTFIDPAVFRNHQLFWIFGGCKNGSNMYMELRDDCKLFNPYEKWIDCGLTFEEFCYKNPNYNFDVQLYDTIGVDPMYIPVFDPPCYVEQVVHETIEYTGEKLDIKYLPTLLDCIKGEDTEYQTVRLPIVLGVAREYNSSDDSWNILKKYLMDWNTSRGMQTDYHMKELKDTFYHGVKGRDKGYTLGTVRYLCEQHNKELYDKWDQDIRDDWNIYANDECEFSDNEDWGEPINIAGEEKKKIAMQSRSEAAAMQSEKKTVIDYKNDKRFFPKILTNIVKSIMKKNYIGEEEYMEDRKKCLNKFVDYCKNRVIYLQEPINCVWYNNKIVKKNDFEKTFEGFGKIQGSKFYFVKPANSIPKIDCFGYLKDYAGRTICDRTDFIPVNGIPDNRIVERNGEKILNTFVGYNPDIYSTEPVPDLSEYKDVVANLIRDHIGDKINDECKEYVLSQPIWMQMYMLAIVNICGGIEYTNYVLKYIAQLIQDPNTLPPIGLLFYSRCRQGKGLLIKMINQIVGDQHVVECNTKEDLFGVHSVPFENTLLVNINEASASEFGKGIVDIMKSFIDGDKVRTANRKNIQAYQYTMKSRIIATTNNANGFAFDIKNGNARINAFESFNYMPSQEIVYSVISKTIDVWKKQGWFTRELYNYFNKIEYTMNEITHIYKTEYIEAIEMAEVDSIELWLQQLNEDSTNIDVWKNSKLKETIPIYSVTPSHYVPAKSLWYAYNVFCEDNKIQSKISSKTFYLELRNYPKYLKFIKKINNTVCYELYHTLCEFDE